MYYQWYHLIWTGYAYGSNLDEVARKDYAAAIPLADRPYTCACYTGLASHYMLDVRRNNPYASTHFGHYYMFVRVDRPVIFVSKIHTTSIDPNYLINYLPRHWRIIHMVILYSERRIANDITVVTAEGSLSASLKVSQEESTKSPVANSIQFIIMKSHTLIGFRPPGLHLTLRIIVAFVALFHLQEGDLNYNR